MSDLREKARALFESWARQHPHFNRCLDTDVNGYVYAETALAFEAWQAARAALASETGWRDIATAPDSYRGEYPKYVLFYNGHHVGVGFCYPSEDGDNLTLYVDESDAIITPKPTHWQPLPAPPATRKES